MSAPEGNQFWKLRSKHGRDRLFETPELLWEACAEYFETCDDNPFIKQEAKTVNVGNYQSEIAIADMRVMRPYTIQGLCRYLNANTQYFNQFEESVKDKEDERSKGFSLILTRVREIIYEQKYSGAASGFFNANIIARDLGLSDKKDIKHEGIPAPPPIQTTGPIKELPDSEDKVE